MEVLRGPVEQENTRGNVDRDLLHHINSRENLKGLKENLIKVDTLEKMRKK